MTQVLQFLLVLLIVVTIGGLEFHVAPMQGYTDRHLRYLYRLLVPQATMWSEMLKPKDLLGASSDKRLKLLSRGQEERLGGDCVLQLGGDDADELVQVIQLARSFGYSQFDLNCGCPSIETNAHFGASLMKRAHDVAELVERMAAASFTPVSVKCRIGVHDTVGEITEDRYESLRSFVEIITASGAVRRVVVHARSAVLQGMSPSSNRQVPPLRYDHVLCLAQEFPHLDVTLNGGIASLVQVQSHMSSGLAGVMCGRWCLSSPFDLLQLPSPSLSVDAVIEEYCKYASAEMHTCKRDEYTAIIAPLAVMYSHIEDILQDPGIADSDASELWLNNFNTLAQCSYSLFVSNNIKGWASDDDEVISQRQYSRLMQVVLGKKYMSKLKGNSAEKI